MIILRPQRGATATARRATALGLSPMIRSLFAVEARPWDAPDAARFDALLLTSANAVRYGGPAISLYCQLPVYAVGTATARAAREAGFSDVTEGHGNAADALRAIAATGHTRPLHLAGEDRTPYPDLPFPVTARTVYAAIPVDVTLPTGRYVALVHSGRAAMRFADLCPSPVLVDIVAISASVAQSTGPGWRSVSIAAKPSDNAMLALAARLCDGKTMPDGRD